MKKTLKGYTVYFIDDVGIKYCFKMNAYRMDDVISEIKRKFGNVYIYSCHSEAPHGKSN